MPSWWMPASCANALRPTMALFDWTGSSVIFESSWLASNSPSDRIAVSYGSRSRRTRSAITISSSDALPARSPMPLIVHSTWRTPPSNAARLLATASPRSSWQCVLKIALSAFGTRRRISSKNSRMSSGVA